MQKNPMTTFSPGLYQNNPRKHEYQSKLDCFSLEGEHAISKLLEYYCLQTAVANNNNNLTANGALGLILGNALSKNNLKKAKKISLNRWKIFDPNLPSTIRKEIDISELDTTLKYDILRNIEAFPTCKRKSRITFVDCRLKNLRKDGVQHDGGVCCLDCMTCTSCWKRSGQTCGTETLVKSLMFIKDGRNMDAHITHSECESIRNGDYTKIPIDKCNTWEDVLFGFQTSICRILDFLVKKSFMTQVEQNQADIRMRAISAYNYETYSVFYWRHIEWLNVENRKMIQNEKPLVIKKQLKMDLQVPESCWTNVFKTMFCMQSGMDIDRPEIKSVMAYLTEKIKVILNTELTRHSGSFQVLEPAIEYSTQTTGYAHSYHIAVDIDFTNSIPKCYEKQFSKESETLRCFFKSALSNLLKAELQEDYKIECTYYKFASIHMKFNVLKLAYKNLTPTEIDKIKMSVRKLASYRPVIRFLTETFKTSFNLKSNFIVSPASKQVPNLVFEISCDSLQTAQDIENYWPYLLKRLEYVPAAQRKSTAKVDQPQKNMPTYDSHRKWCLINKWIVKILLIILCILFTLQWLSLTLAKCRILFI